MYFKPCEVVHGEVRWVVSPLCSFPWPSGSESPGARPRAAVTPGWVAGSQCHHLAPAPLKHEETKTHLNGSLSLSMLCSLQFYSLFVGRRLVQGRASSWSPASDLRWAVVPDEHLQPECHQPAGPVGSGFLSSHELLCLDSSWCWWQHPREGVLLWEGRALAGWVQHAAGKYTWRVLLSSARPSPLKSQAFMACTGWLWLTRDT